ncbi:uncharacterized protein LOC144440342 [Glandiceps talaboti]
MYHSYVIFPNYTTFISRQFCGLRTMRLLRVFLLFGVVCSLYLVFVLDSKCTPHRDSSDEMSTDIATNAEREVQQFIIQTNTNYNDDDSSVDIETSDLSTFTPIDMDTDLRSPVRFILPIYLRGGGPNWQYNNFKAAVRLAVYYERTVIAMPFVAHRTHHSSNDLRDFQDTFDVDELRKLLPVASIEDFHEHCHGNVEAILTPSSIFPPFIAMYESHYQKCADLIMSTWNITIPDFSSIPSGDDARRRYFHEISDVSCLAIFHPINTFGLEVPDGLEYTPWIDIPDGGHIANLTYRYLQRTDLIKTMTDIALESVCQGDTFMAIHWRNKTGERCALPSADVAECNKISPVLTNITRTIMVEGIERMAKQNNLDCLYIARPSYSTDIEEYLESRFSKIYTADDIQLIDNPKLSILRDDNYVLSLVEQEICARSTLFGSTWLSSWSKFVVEERLANDLEVFYFYKFPGLTEEISLYF